MSNYLLELNMKISNTLEQIFDFDQVESYEKNDHIYRNKEDTQDAIDLIDDMTLDKPTYQNL